MTYKPFKVFILEDQNTDLTLIKRQVLKYNPDSTFLVARNRVEFERNIEWDIKPDLVISDYELPDINGLQALITIRRRLPKIPFVFVTGTLDNQEKVAASILNGADGFILKDNIDNLHISLDQIMSDNDIKLNKHKAKMERKRRRNILLQRLENKAAILSDENKEDILDIIRQLQEL